MTINPRNGLMPLRHPAWSLEEAALLSPGQRPGGRANQRRMDDVKASSGSRPWAVRFLSWKPNVASASKRRVGEPWRAYPGNLHPTPVSKGEPQRGFRIGFTPHACRLPAHRVPHTRWLAGLPMVATPCVSHVNALREADAEPPLGFRADRDVVGVVSRGALARARHPFALMRKPVGLAWVFRPCVNLRISGHSFKGNRGCQ